MSVFASIPSSGFPLSGPEGELVTVQLSVAPRHLEKLLDALCEVTFPINPSICHAGVPPRYARTTVVEFPAYAGRLEEVHRVLATQSFPLEGFLVTTMFESSRPGVEQHPARN